MGFWDDINAQLDAVEQATNADAVIAALGGRSNASSGDAFFAGSGGDRTLMSALITAGWKLTWAEASYYYVMRAPNGDLITYVEGDVYLGDVHKD